MQMSFQRELEWIRGMSESTRDSSSALSERFAGCGRPALAESVTIVQHLLGPARCLLRGLRRFPLEEHLQLAAFDSFFQVVDSAFAGLLRSRLDLCGQRDSQLSGNPQLLSASQPIAQFAGAGALEREPVSQPFTFFGFCLRVDEMVELCHGKFQGSAAVLLFESADPQQTRQGSCASH
jgi:hypothetical protein